MEIVPSPDVIDAAIQGVDLAQPLSEAQFARIDAADQALRYQQPAVVHPVVRTHPYTGRKCLYVSKGECEGIEGMPTDEALALIDELADHTIDPKFRHIHRWHVHDLLIWDNCAVQHLASLDYEWPKHRRLMHRVTVDGTIPVQRRC